GDFKHATEALRLLRRAHESAPENGIVLGNYVGDLERMGFTALAGQALRMELLHEFPDRSWLESVQPPISPKEWAERARSQPELGREGELGARAVVRSPGREAGYG